MVGAFLLVVLLIGIVLAVLLLRASDYFVEKNNYWIEIDQSELDGLRRGVEITMLGQSVGEIQSVQYVDASNRVRVNLAIAAKYADQIFESSVLVPDRKFGVGTPVLELRRGNLGGNEMIPLEPGSRITAYHNEADRIDQVAREVESVSDSVLKIQQKLDPALTSVDRAAVDFGESVTTSLNPALEQVKTASSAFEESNEVIRPDAIATLEAVRTATTDLQQRVGTLTETIQSLVENDMQETLADVRQSTDDVSDAARQIGNTADSTNQEIANALVTVKQAAESVRRLAEETREVVRIVRREADDLPGTTARVNDTVNDTQDLVDEVRGHWLLRRSSKRGRPTTTISPSGVRVGVGR